MDKHDLILKELDAMDAEKLAALEAEQRPRFSYKTEQAIYDALIEAGFGVLTETQHPSKLDFTVENIGIEVKSYHSPRAIEQMRRVANGILIQGDDAAAFFVKLLEAYKESSDV